MVHGCTDAATGRGKGLMRGGGGRRGSGGAVWWEKKKGEGGLRDGVTLPLVRGCTDAPLNGKTAKTALCCFCKRF
jgi:hypothetical protein